jgi:ATP-binding cassette subfamily B protein
MKKEPINLKPEHPSQETKKDHLPQAGKSHGGKPPKRPPGPSLTDLLKPYKKWVLLLVFFAFVSNALNLVLPKLIANSIDNYQTGNFVLNTVILEFSAAAICVFIFAILQSIIQNYTAELVAKDLREKLAAKISRQSTEYIQQVTPGRLLTNLTSDIDSIKMFVSTAIVSLISSAVLIIGSSIMLLLIDWKLALVVLTIIPIIGITFFVVLKKVRALFGESRLVIDWLNKVINESILGASLIRVLNSKNKEHAKFLDANSKAKDIGLNILKLFAGLIPVITFVGGMANIAILLLGGYFVINHEMTLGGLAAFNSYVLIFIFPILVLGFISNLIAQASASYARVGEVLSAEEKKDTGTITKKLHGDIDVKNVTVIYGEKPVLKNVTLSIKAGKKTAIIGPTAAGKTQLLNLLVGLFQPNSGTIEYDQKNLNEYNKTSLHSQIGFVFQDSIIFNMSLRENIAFSETVTDKDLQKAIDTAELQDFVNALPDKLNTVVSERGTSLSGGQKQRIMLARALALNPKILLLDDFTARVDRRTEQKILANIHKNYPDITLLSVTQKISSIEHYDQIILLMEGEVLAHGKHQELMETSPEYVQINNSQQSTNHYELRA